MYGITIISVIEMTDNVHNLTLIGCVLHNLYVALDKSIC